MRGVEYGEERWEKEAGYIQLMENVALMVEMIRHCHICAASSAAVAVVTWFLSTLAIFA